MNNFRYSVANLYSRVIEPVNLHEGPGASFNGSQIPDEFFGAWNSISNFYDSNPTKHISFLEIGAYRGLWALALSEFCNEKGLSYEYATVTYMEQDANNNPLYNVQKYYEGNNVKFNLINSPSQDKSLLERLNPSYNIVFIDGDHSYNMVMEDIAIYAPIATDMVLFHDIRPKQPNPGCGVYLAINDSGLELHEEIVVDGDWMGIGIHYV